MMPRATLTARVVAQSCQTLCNPVDCTCQAPLSSSISWCLLRFMSIESVMPSNHLILYHPLLLLSSIFPSIKVFSNESALRIRWPKYWSFSFSISSSNEYLGLISFRIDGLISLLSKGLSKVFSSTSSKASILQHLTLFMVQLTLLHHYWKSHSFDYRSLLFKMLSRFVIAFLPRSKHLFLKKSYGYSHFPQWFWSPRK